MVSVAMCTYNGANYIEEQLLSIFGQTKYVDEIVICDDQSTDDTVGLIRHLAERSPGRIRLFINEERLHVSANFEKAILLCKGDFIFLSDQDDVWHANKVETLCNWLFLHPDKDVVFSNTRIVDKKGKPLTEKTLFDISGLDEKALKWFDDGLAPEMFLYVCRAGGLTMAMRKSFVPKIRVRRDVWKVALGAIHDESIALCAIGYNKLGYCNEVLMDYRLHGDNSEGMGIGFNTVFKNPNPYRAFFIDMNRYGEFPDSLIQRAEFINLRYQSRYKNGFKLLINNTINGKYRSIYGNKAWRFFFWDLYDYYIHLASRVVLKFKKKGNQETV